MGEEFQERDSRGVRSATALPGPRKNWPARFERRKLEWSPNRFTGMGEGVHGSTNRSCRPPIFLRISMVARAFLDQRTRGVVGLCNRKWRAAYLRCASIRSCSGSNGWTLRKSDPSVAAVAYFQSLRAGSNCERRLAVQRDAIAIARSAPQGEADFIGTRPSGASDLTPSNCGGWVANVKSAPSRRI